MLVAISEEPVSEWDALWASSLHKKTHSTEGNKFVRLVEDSGDLEKITEAWEPPLDVSE